MNWLAIINPQGGGRKTGGDMERMIGALRPITSNCIVTRYPGHAEELARSRDGIEGLLIVGGDGTLHEVLRGLDGQDFVVAIVPAGTGNSLARDLGLNTMKAALEAVRIGRWLSIDLMRVSFKDGEGLERQSMAASTVALGYPVAATKIAEQRLKGLGRFCYPVAATLEALWQKRFAVQFRHSHAPRESYWLSGLLINNTRHVANFPAFPNASVQDGMLEVMELNAGFVKQVVHNVSILSRLNFYTPALIRREAFLIADLPSPQELMIDGEIYPEITNLKVEVLPRRLRCIRGATVHP